MNPNTIIRQVLEDPGYSTALSLNEAELTFFRGAIEKQWLETIENTYPEHVEKFKNIGIANYHQLSDLIDHNALWNKVNRCLPQDVVDKIKKLPFLKKLKEVFGEFKISDIAYDDQVKIGYEEIYWRLVRPNIATDVGSLHTDKWFHEILNFDEKILAKDAYTIKIWLPIFCEPGKNGLLIVPNSHKKTWEHSMKIVNGLPKPVLLEKAEAILIDTRPGNMLIFNENMLHGGAKNLGLETRVSVEITMVFKKLAL